MDKYEEFITSFAESAVRICKKYNLYPSVCIAQACIESTWGEDAIKTYNLFGRKAVNGDEYIELPTREQLEDGSYITIDAKFKVYHSFDEAFEDYCILLTEQEEYQPALIFIGKDRDSYIRRMALVYATEKKYADMIIDTINANELWRYDE